MLEINKIHQGDALENNRNFIGFELDNKCIKNIANPRIKQTEPDMF